jgi:hypothetical protein
MSEPTTTMRDKIAELVDPSVPWALHESVQRSVYQLMRSSLQSHLYWDVKVSVERSLWTNRSLVEDDVRRSLDGGLRE